VGKSDVVGNTRIVAGGSEEPPRMSDPNEGHAHSTRLAPQKEPVKTHLIATTGETGLTMSTSAGKNESNGEKAGNDHQQGSQRPSEDLRELLEAILPKLMQQALQKPLNELLVQTSNLSNGMNKVAAGLNELKETVRKSNIRSGRAFIPPEKSLFLSPHKGRIKEAIGERFNKLKTPFVLKDVDADSGKTYDDAVDEIIDATVDRIIGTAGKGEKRLTIKTCVQCLENEVNKKGHGKIPSLTKAAYLEAIWMLDGQDDCLLKITQGGPSGYKPGQYTHRQSKKFKKGEKRSDGRDDVHRGDRKRHQNGDQGGMRRHRSNSRDTHRRSYSDDRREYK
jgi:hypothetical protein